MCLTMVSNRCVNRRFYMIRIGLDVGSTTAKLAVIGNNGYILHTQYVRHNARAKEAILSLLAEAMPVCGDADVSLRLTGSVGMGFAERHSLPFVQEVVAATHAIKYNYPSTRTMIDIGGEDAKVVFFKDGQATDLRMNGNCAGGTGAFIDQMAIILGVETAQLNQLAANATHVYPIASRCGVFSKTDIQNLIAKNVSREDVAASIFHAVAVQTVTTLAHGCDIESPVLMCGGPLTFIPALRKAFSDYLTLAEHDIILPDRGALLPAIGAAIADIDNLRAEPLAAIIDSINNFVPVVKSAKAALLSPIFKSKEDYDNWTARMTRHAIKRSRLQPGAQDVYIGIDSGSTTTKIVVLNHRSEMLYSYYKSNGGNPIQAVSNGLRLLDEECRNAGATLCIKGSCSTGYGEDLIKAAFSLHSGIIETIAHYMAASHLDHDVSFILDIGGQDMKAIFVNNGIVDRIELNEACSSGCGSFIETFARSLGYTPQQFAQAACHSSAPCDLGTRCTVFMNSKVKQVLREGASVEDIAAGLAYSVVKNCLYKVLKLKDTSSLGKHIVVQGGTMRNDAIVKGLELLTGAEVTRCDCPELMGAYGCALYAKSHTGEARRLADVLSQAAYTTRQSNCHGCENQCLIQTYIFANGKRYHSGNRCEKIFNNGSSFGANGMNAYSVKHDMLFNRDNAPAHPTKTVGIPRALNAFEEYPFWHTLFTECGIGVCLSEASNFTHYEKCARMVMSDNICFPAKLVHSHIEYLQQQGVDRIFMPFVIHEPHTQGDQNSYNCPIVTGYSTVIRSSQPTSVPVDSPTISFKERDLLLQQCADYLGTTFGIDRKTVAKAFVKAEAELVRFHSRLVDVNVEILSHAKESGNLCIMLVGRPYHTDPLIQHNVSQLLASMGIDVITDDIVRNASPIADNAHYLSQWAYPNRILKAAKWCAEQGDHVQFVQMTSFGCGPDAFLNDEVRDLLLRHHKAPTLLKLDDINNVGSMKLRIRSMVESLKIAQERHRLSAGDKGFKTTPVYDKTYRHRKILVPFFTPYLSPLIPSVLKLSGYDIVNLPLSDQQSCEWGLKYANNEVCYPATLIVGDIIKAFRSGQHDPAQSAVAITQTGGQCRASNYLPLIKKALVDAGYPNVPVVSLSFGSDIDNDQPAFKINWMKLLPVALRTILYSDCISKFFHATAARETEPGKATMLAQLYLQKGSQLIEAGRSSELTGLLADAAVQFNAICREQDLPRVGIVGEIFLKFNPFAQKNVIDWLIAHGIEPMPPLLLDFFMQSFVNRRVNIDTHIERKNLLADAALAGVYKMVKSQIAKVNKIASQFKYYNPFSDIFNEAEMAKEVITLNAQFGEGWLLPAEIISFARHGVNSVISLQPFGCIANHIVSKGVEKRIKNLYPQMNLLSLDFDSGVSDVNVTNRLLLFIDKIKQHEYSRQ